MKEKDELNIPSLSFDHDKSQDGLSEQNAHGAGNEARSAHTRTSHHEDTDDRALDADGLLAEDMKADYGAKDFDPQDFDTQELFMFKWKKPGRFKEKIRSFWENMQKKKRRAKFEAGVALGNNWQTPFFVSLIGAVIGCMLFTTVFGFTNAILNPKPVVEQNTKPTHEYIPPKANESQTSAVVAAVSPGIVTVLTGNRQHYLSGNGSGIVYKEKDGKIYILTNAHVIEDAAVIEVYRNDLGAAAVDRAEVLAADNLNDIAVLVIDKPQQLYPVAISFEDSSKLKVGQKVLAIGSPYVATLGTSFSGSVTEGIISGLNREIEAAKDVGLRKRKVVIQKYIQTDAAINGGNSGGALIDMNGNLIGMNSARINSADNIGFAIATNDIIAAMEEMKVLLPTTVSYPVNTDARGVH